MLERHLGCGDLADETIADSVGLRLAAAIEAVAEDDGRLGSTKKRT